MVWGQYRVIIDGYMYYYDTLDEACKRFCDILKAINVDFFWNTGRFEKTKNFNNVWKIKKYVLEITHPKMKLTIHYRGKEELLPELVMYTLSKYIKKADT